MKTAISIPNDLFKSVDELSAEMDLSRSQIFADAMRAYLHQRKSEKMLRAINEVYSCPETEEEAMVRKQSKKRYVKTLKHAQW
jgi:metal-responsive CopG/Arc/MetJ family transcriptional regulator